MPTASSPLQRLPGAGDDVRRGTRRNRGRDGHGAPVRPRAQPLHPAFNALDRALTGGSGDAFRLTVANSAWGQKGKRFEPAYLDTLARYYGAGMHLVDFAGGPERSRTAINDWVDDGRGPTSSKTSPGGLDYPVDPPRAHGRD